MELAGVKRRWKPRRRHTMLIAAFRGVHQGRELSFEERTGLLRKALPGVRELRPDARKQLILFVRKNPEAFSKIMGSKLRVVAALLGEDLRLFAKAVDLKSFVAGAGVNWRHFLYGAYKNWRHFAEGAATTEFGSTLVKASKKRISQITLAHLGSGFRSRE